MVKSAEKTQMIMEACQAIVGIEDDKPEDLSDLDRKMNPPTIKFEGPKVGRNDPCPCGSEKKFKKCCVE